MGGKSRSSSTTKSSSTDQRVGADAGAIAVGAGASLQITDEFPDEAREVVVQAFESIEETGQRATDLAKSTGQSATDLAKSISLATVNLARDAIGSVANTARGAGDIIGKIAERQKADESGTQLQDFLPFVGVAGGLVVLFALVNK